MRSFLVLLGLLLTGCEATFESQARDAFSDAFGCQPTQVVVGEASKPDQGDVSYAAVRTEGCGHRETYVCASDWTIGCHPKRVGAQPNEADANLLGP
jgi:hypothetical protein